jgi:hypothetical protein
VSIDIGDINPHASLQFGLEVSTGVVGDPESTRGGVSIDGSSNCSQKLDTPSPSVFGIDKGGVSDTGADCLCGIVCVVGSPKNSAFWGAGVGGVSLFCFSTASGSL